MSEDAEERPAPSKYVRLPEPVRIEDTVEERPASDPRDPDGGRNPDNDFMLRYSG